LKAPADIIEAFAGYLWAGLGSPASAIRWQYAHAVRACVEIHWPPLLSALVHFGLTGPIQAFSDHRLVFYSWHAQQWFAFGLARGGEENPAALLSAVDWIRHWVVQDHVVIRGVAAEMLKRIAPLGSVECAEMMGLDQVNHSPFAVVPYRGWEREDEWGEGERDIEDGERYYFGIDIGPYWLQPLGKAFGITEAATVRRVRQIIEGRFGWKRDSWRDDARHVRSVFRDGETIHSHGSLPKVDDLTVYYAYHGMMVAAGELLKTHAIRISEGDRKNHFEEWLEPFRLTRCDGRWLADRRDPRIVVEPPSADQFGDRVWAWTVTREYLDSQLRRDDGMYVLWGSWTGGGEDCRETVCVRSALVTTSAAEALLTALQTSQELGRFNLPSAEYMHEFETSEAKVTPWVSEEYAPRGLDEADFWAIGLRYPSPSPTEAVASALGLEADDERRSWSVTNEVVLRSESWTREQGYGREAQRVAGWRLSGSKLFLERLLVAHPHQRLIASVEVQRSFPRYGEITSNFEGYPSPYVRFYLVGSDGIALSL
jgi:hypothetical protein